MVEREQRD
jgi:nicotinamidase-related amidase